MEDKKLIIDELNDLYESGVLKKLIDGGFISSSVYLWRNVYNAYNFRLKANKSIMQAMEDVSTNFKISIASVRKIRSKFDC